MGPFRPRRSCLAVPASSVKMLTRARELPADEVFLDLEDAVAPPAKEQARANAVSALSEGDWGTKILAVRVNDLTTPWTLRDVITIVEGAGAALDCLILPKVTGPEQIWWLEHTLTQLESSLGLEVGRTGIEAQIEDPRGLVNVDAIAGSSPRLETLVFGPADFMASVNMRSLAVGQLHVDYPGDPYHHILMRILVAARARDLQAIDGPFLQIRDTEGLRASARRSALLGYDGKWVLHPGQIAAANEIYSPAQADYDRAELILDAYEYHASHAGGARGAIMLGDEMIDEASRKMALVIASRGRAAGMTRTSSFAPPG